MKQLTREQAISLAESGEWRDWTDDEIVKFQLFQECLAVPFDRFQEAMENVLGRPVFTHEFAYADNLKAEYLGDKPAPTLADIIGLLPNAIVLEVGSEN